MNFKKEIKIALSSKATLVFVKVPDCVDEIAINKNTNKLSGWLICENSVNWFSKKLPFKNLNFIGFSHNLTDDQISTLFSSRDEFYKICNDNEIYYNYSAYTGKWAVLYKSM